MDSENLHRRLRKIVGQVQAIDRMIDEDVPCEDILSQISAAKSALSNLTMWLAAYFAAAGIRVNAIAPGFFVTEQNRALLYAADGTPTPRTEKILAATPMRRFGEPEELLGALMFLVDPRASGFVTGVVLPVDGGFSAYSGV